MGVTVPVATTPTATATTEAGRAAALTRAPAGRAATLTRAPAGPAATLTRAPAGPAATLTQAPAGRQRLDGNQVSRLVRSAAAGTPGSWESLVAEFGSLVWAVVRSFRLNDADAADVAQTTWLRLIEHLDDLNDTTRVGPWLATTARRECLRVMREGSRDVLYGDEIPVEDTTGEHLDAGMLAEERDQALWRAFGRLRDSDQALLRVLMADPRPSYEEISAALDLPIGSIGPTRARAIERLRRELAREGSLSLLTA